MYREEIIASTTCVAAKMEGIVQSIGLDNANGKAMNTTNDIPTETEYWWKTTGQDLDNMLQEANYPEGAQRQFLSFYHSHVCPQLGSLPSSTSAKSAIGKDGDCFEYSFEFKGTTANPGVRFGMDLSPLRPVDKENPLSIAPSQTVIDALKKRTSKFDVTWYNAMCSYFVKSHLSTKEQEALVEKAGHQMPMVIGFDIHRGLEGAPNTLPVMGKVYFPPCFAAAEQGLSRWDAVRNAIRRLPRIIEFPNIIRSLETIEEYLAGKPKEYQDGVRYLATDFLAPEKTRLKIYMRYPKRDFEGVWEFYTLGGRIKGLEEDKEKYRDLMNLMSDDHNAAEGTAQVPAPTANGSVLGKPRVKTTTIYFSLSADNPGPAPKIGFFPANTASNDQVIAKGLDQWLSKYGWYDGGKTLEERLDSAL